MTKHILENYSDIGLDYDISFVTTKVFDVPSYNTIYVLTEDNSPSDVAMMAIEAIDRSDNHFLDYNILSVVDDIRNWFSHPEDNNTTLTTDFWHGVEDFMYSEQEIEIHEAYEWQRELDAMNSERQRELVNEWR
jgi:hypothetical protein